MYHHCYRPTRAAWQPCAIPVGYYYFIPWCCACGQPAASCRCCREDEGLTRYLAQELTVDGSTETANRETVVGGSADVEPVLETLPAPEADSPEVTVEKVVGAVTTPLFQASPVPGYTVNHDLAAVSPGAKLILTASGCFARLRWCERIEY